jgi:hypothetical protein
VNAFLVDVLMTESSLGANLNYLTVPGEDPSLISASFNFSALDVKP